MREAITGWVRILLLPFLISSQLQAQPLKVGVSFAIPPYVNVQEKRGIELDILREAFAGSRYQLDFDFLPLERTFRLFEAGKLDAIINVKPGMVAPAQLTTPVIRFHNRVFALSHRHIHTLDDLRHLKVSAFQRATVFLGDAFAAMANQNPHYEEVAKQQLQVHQLMLGRIDAAILEERIFYYYLDQLSANAQDGRLFQRDRVRQTNLFPPNIYHFAFRDEEARALFDRQLAAMRSDGRYQRIFATYNATP